MPARTQISTVRQGWAIGLGVLTLLCTLGMYFAMAVTMLALTQTGYDAPPFFPGIIGLVGMLLTFPPALLCTIIALVLAGPRRSKLAWVSLCLYFLPFVVAVGARLLKLVR